MKSAHGAIQPSQIHLAKKILVVCPECGVTGPRTRLAEHLMGDHRWAPSVAYRAQAAA